MNKNKNTNNNNNNNKSKTTTSKANYDDVTTQLYLGCFVVVVNVGKIFVVVLIFVAVFILGLVMVNNA